MHLYQGCSLVTTCFLPSQCACVLEDPRIRDLALKVSASVLRSCWSKPRLETYLCCSEKGRRFGVRLIWVWMAVLSINTSLWPWEGYLTFTALTFLILRLLHWFPSVPRSGGMKEVQYLSRHSTGNFGASTRSGLPGCHFPHSAL